MAIVEITEANFEQTLMQEGITILDFWAPWCGPCKSFAPIFADASERHTDITFGKVNTEEQQALAGTFQIRSIPTTMVFRDGIRLFNQPGLLPASALDDVLEQARALDMEQVRAQISEASDAK